MSERKIKVKYSLTLLNELLLLPKDSKIVGVRLDPFSPHEVEFLVENDIFPETIEGNPYPNAIIEVHTDVMHWGDSIRYMNRPLKLKLFEDGKFIDVSY